MLLQNDYHFEVAFFVCEYNRKYTFNAFQEILNYAQKVYSCGGIYDKRVNDSM